VFPERKLGSLEREESLAVTKYLLYYEGFLHSFLIITEKRSEVISKPYMKEEVFPSLAFFTLFIRITELK
jgi:hypothetical protein